MAVRRRPGIRRSPHPAGERHDYPHTPQGPGLTTPQLRPQGPLRRGTEPVTARSDLELRRLLSWILPTLFLGGAAGLLVLAARAGNGPEPNRDTYLVLASVCVGFTALAWFDLLVVRRRLAAGQGRRRPGRKPR
ncbi:hypothetical protein ABT095_18430 [Kitasatospora sp. NPDC002227]|uniref:hypothetical protein n=1 Tax=Kitasatospora sp. NPDC002227 TaxID=3154773 RepID=UPI0033346171